jgi:hypothetical protein
MTSYEELAKAEPQAVEQIVGRLVVPTITGSVGQDHAVARRR